LAARQKIGIVFFRVSSQCLLRFVPIGYPVLSETEYMDGLLHRQQENDYFGDFFNRWIMRRKNPCWACGGVIMLGVRTYQGEADGITTM
jgi:hypothetical protein